MRPRKFSIDQRLQNFWVAIQHFDYKSWPFIIYSLGSLIGFLTLVTLPKYGFHANAIAAYFIFGFFWLQLITLISDELKPPTELNILLTLQFLIILRQTVYYDSGISQFFYFVALVGYAMFFSLIIFQYKEGRFTTLVAIFIFAYFFLEFSKSEHEFLLLLVKILIFISLLKRLKWLENLSKTECWIYFFAALFIFRQLFNSTVIYAPELGTTPSPFQNGLVAYALYLMLAYTLAIAVKTPVVLVYNHARLARKLWISSLFQSTFPQIFQFVLMLLVFQFFISGWQADQVRFAIGDLFERIQENDQPIGIRSYAIERDALHRGVDLDGYILQHDYGAVPKEGIITLQQRSDTAAASEVDQALFLFHRDKRTPRIVYFVRLDTGFLDYLGSAFVPVAGNGILGYPYKPNRWENYIYSLDYWQKDDAIRIFPFSWTPYEKNAPLTGEFYRKNQQEGEDFSDLGIRIFGQDQFTFGRLFIDYYSSAFISDGYFACDVILKPNAAIFSTAVFRNLLMLFIAYLLINSLLIRRVVKFGAEINQMIVQKFNHLQGGIREIASGNLDFKVQVEGQDEFVELATHFNNMGDRLKKTIAEAREKGRLEHELQIAREVQLSLLPRQLPVVSGYAVEAFFEMATEVGGDFYDMQPLGDDKYLFTIGDVSGKGTSAAFYMAQCVSLLRFAPQFTRNVNEIIKRLNQYFAGPAMDRQMFITAIIGIFDAAKHSLEFIRAGHTLPFLIPGDFNEPIQELASAGIGIGLARDSQQMEKSLKPGKCKLKSGDKLFCFTDGLVEAQRHGQGETEDQFFGEERLQKILTENRKLPAHQLIKKIVQELGEFYGNAPLADDFTLFIIERKKQMR